MSLTGIIGGVLGTVKGIVTLDADQTFEGVMKTGKSTWTTIASVLETSVGYLPAAPKIIHDKEDHEDSSDWTKGT